VGLRNNLRNIGPGSPVYDITAGRITELARRNMASEDAGLLLELRQFPVIAGDTFFLYYSMNPILASENHDKVLGAVLEHYRKHVETEDYKRARVLTELDDQLSTVYAMTFMEVLAEKLAEKLREDREKYREFTEVLRRMKELRENLGQRAPQPSTAGTCPIGLPGLPTPAPGGAGGEEGEPSGQPASPTAPTQPPELEELQERAQELLGQALSDDALREAVAEAEAKAREATEKVAELQRMIGGREAGKAPGSLEKLASLADMILRQRVDVQAIELAGRIADSMPRFVKVLKERDKLGEELGGYRLTRNPERALPRELALPEVFYYKLANSGLLAKEKVTVKEGAFYVLLDKSGSMAEGGKFTWANATALALLKLARAKGRRFYARLFDHRVYQLLDDSDPFRLSEELLTTVPDGGTSIDSALRTALRDLAEGGLSEKTNTVIIITDGEDEVTVKPEEFKKVNATLVAVMVKGYNARLEELARATGGKYMKVEPTREGTLRVVDAVRGGGGGGVL
jgi:uncharacterized protein with von Willebrand factor type A (vWA) domain